MSLFGKYVKCLDDRYVRVTHRFVVGTPLNFASCAISRTLNKWAALMISNKNKTLIYALTEALCAPGTTFLRIPEHLGATNPGKFKILIPPCALESAYIYPSMSPFRLSANEISIL